MKTPTKEQIEAAISLEKSLSCDLDQEAGKHCNTCLFALRTLRLLQEVMEENRKALESNCLSFEERTVHLSSLETARIILEKAGEVK